MIIKLQKKKKENGSLWCSKIFLKIQMCAEVGLVQGDSLMRALTLLTHWQGQNSMALLEHNGNLGADPRDMILGTRCILFQVPLPLLFPSSSVSWSPWGEVSSFHPWCFSVAMTTGTPKISKIWKKIYLCQQALTEAISKISGIDLWWLGLIWISKQQVQKGMAR